MQNFEVTKIAQDVFKIKLISSDFSCRIWVYQYEAINNFLTKNSNMLVFSECIFDIDQHYRDLTLARQNDDKVLVTCHEYDNEGDIEKIEFSIDSVELCKLFNQILVPDLTD